MDARRWTLLRAAASASWWSRPLCVAAWRQSAWVACAARAAGRSAVVDVIVHGISIYTNVWRPREPRGHAPWPLQRCSNVSLRSGATRVRWVAVCVSGSNCVTLARASEMNRGEMGVLCWSRCGYYFMLYHAQKIAIDECTHMYHLGVHARYLRYTLPVRARTQEAHRLVWWRVWWGVMWAVDKSLAPLYCVSECLRAATITMFDFGCNWVFVCGARGLATRVIGFLF